MAKKKSIWHSIDEKPKKDCSILIGYDEYDDYKVAIYSPRWDTVYTDEAPDGESWSGVIRSIDLIGGAILTI